MNPQDKTTALPPEWPEHVTLNPVAFQQLLDKPLRVLLADDEETIVLTSLELFRREGWEGQGAHSAEQAEALLEREEFDVVVLDYKMPGNEELELLHHIAAGFPGLPVIMITGYPSLESAIASVQQKAFDYVTKPLDMGHLLKRAHEAAERYRLRQALLRSEQRYQSLIDDVLEVSQVALMIVDAEHRVAWVNRAMERFFGFQRETVVGEPIDAFISGGFMQVFENPEEFRRVMTVAYSNNVYPEHFECRVTESDDRKERWLEHWSQPIASGLYAGGRIEQYVDITSRKRAEEELRGSRERFRTVADFTHDWEMWLDAFGELLYISPSCRRVTGYSPEEFIENPSLLFAIAHPEDRPLVEQHYREAPNSTESHTLEFRIVAKDGRVRWVSHVCQPVEGADGETLGRRASHRDITDRREAEEELRKREGILEAIGFAAARFLREESWERSIETVLERLGKASGVSRVCVFQNEPREDGGFLMVPRFDWTAPDFRGTLEAPLMQDVPYRAAGLERWEETLARGESICGNVRDLPTSERRLLLQQEIVSILVLPLFAGRQWWGFIGFEESVTERSWPRTEVEALRAAADTLSAAIQREITENALRSKEAFLRHIQEVTLDAVEVIDRDGVIVWHNTLAGEIYGNKIGSKCFENLNRESRCPDCAHIAIQQDGVPRDYECRVVDKRGRSRTMWVRATPMHGPKGDITAIVETSRDITERMRMEEALRESQRRLDLALAGSNLGLWDWDLAENRIYRDERLAAILGYTPDTVQDHRFDPEWPLHPDDLESFRKAWTDHVEGHTASCEFRVRMRCQSKAWRWMLVHGQVCERNPNGNPLRATGTIRDITELVLAEHERKRLLERMRQTHKIESLAALAGGIAHDFNNLLMGIMGNAHLALAELPQDSPVRHHLDEIETVSQRAALLANQMLAYAGHGQLATQRLDLSETLQDMAPLLSACLPRRIRLRYDLREGLPPLLGDDRQLRQLVIALVHNAREALGDRTGEITLRTGSIEADSVYLANTYVDDALEPGEYLFLEIADNGPGILPDILPKVFDPFFSTKPSGRGLGLAAVLGIVRAHKGAIRLDSRLGMGSRFTVLLPTVPGEDISAAPPPESSPEELEATGMILLVDDEEPVLKVGEALLKRIGFGVLKARDGIEALDVFERYSDAIVCVVLDLSMPRMGGEETIDKLRERAPELPILVASGYSAQDVTERFSGQKHTLFLHKPYTSEQLRDSLRALLSK